MRRLAGRQLARAGAGFDKLGRRRLAERVLAAAVRLAPEHRAGWFRLGRVRERRKDWPGAETAYARAVGAGSPPAAWWFRLGRVRQRRRDWRGAESAYAAAVRLRPEAALWHGHRAQVAEQRQAWVEAAEGFLRAREQQPDQPAWAAGLARAHTGQRRPAEAVDRCVQALAGAPDDQPLRRALAGGYEALGQWRAAADVLRELVAERPDDHALRNQLVQVLEQQQIVPFELDRTGRPAGAAGPEAAEAAYREAVANLEHLAGHAPARVRDLYQLGRLHERHGAAGPAAAAYREALARLATADAWWGHQSGHVWRFRLAYVERPDQPADPRLRRTATPVPGPGELAPAGFFEALVTDQGLRLSGFLAPSAGGGVDIQLDGQPLRHLAADAGQWRPGFLFDLTEEVLRDFPERGEITVLAGGARLATVGGGTAVRLAVPGGSGKLPALLAGGRSLTKKGSWSLTGAELADRQQRYLQVYQRAKAELAERLGRHLFLCYGTLLGCYRDGDFIPGDDDFDAAYVSTAPDPAAFRRECREVALELLRRGLDINLSINGRPFKVGIEGVWVDITPIWLYRGRAWSFDAHELTAEALEPVRRAGFRGTEVYLPADPEAFLADTYGPEWRTPQPDFRYYRTRDDNRTLARMWLTPSEVRELAQLAGAERARDQSAGRFVGVGVPAYPPFSG